MDANYARQSRDKKDSISIESQFDFCMREVFEGTEVKKYKDKGFSGKNTDRPDFQRMMKDIKAGKIKRVIVYRLDRISRSLLDFSSMFETFKKYDVEFVSVSEKFDTSTPVGKAMLSIIMIFAELERETIQQRITDNYYERGKLGMFLGGNVPFGFELMPTKIDGKKTNMLSPTNKIEYIKELFDKYSSTNTSLKSLAYGLNDSGVKTKFENNWDSAKISRLLKSPVYVKADVDIYNYFKNMGCIFHNDLEEYNGENGLYVYGNNVSTSTKFQNLEGYHVVITPHEGIVDSETWLKCQYKLSKNKQIKNSGKSKYSWLSGLIKCKKCEYAMSVNKSILSPKNGTYAFYFRCSGRALKKVCDAKSVRIDKIEQIVEENMFNYINTLSNTLKIDKVKETKKINDLKISISNKETEIENLVDNLASAKVVAMKYINQRIEKIDSELTLLKEELKKINLDDSLDNEEIIEFRKLIPIWSQLTIDEKKVFSIKLIDKVYVEDDDVKIIWNY